MTTGVPARKRPKVLMALYYYHPYVSGLSVYAKWIAEALAERGYEVTVLTSRHDKSLAKHEVVGGVTVVRKPVLLRLGKGVIMPTFWLSMAWRARKHDYLNVHLPMAESGMAALFIPKKKIIATYHCDLYLGAKVLDRCITRLSIALMRLQLSRSRVVIANTKDYFEHSQMKRFVSKLQPVYPPVPRSRAGGDSQLFFKRLGISKRTVKIGFVGRIVYEKGLSYLLETIPLIQEEVPDFKVILLGDYAKVAGGSIKNQLDAYLAKYPERIVFTGYVSDEDRDAFYAGLDVFVLPSIDPLESFGIVQVEAMLGGAPVVASDLPGVREVVQKTGYGRLAKPKDAADIAKQIVEVVKQPDQYKPDQKVLRELFDPKDSIDAYIAYMPR